MPGWFSSGCSGPFFSVVLLLTGSVVTSPAADVSAPDLLSRDRAILAESYCGEKLWIWQNRLKLQDWKITVVMSHPSDLKPRTLGNIHWDADKRSAVIRVLDASEYRLPYRAMLDDMEFTVLHELIHLELSSLPRSDASRSAEEHAVNRMTEALLQLDRVK
jgi:hypothetical protein